MRFTYTNVPPQGAVATLQCTQQVQIMFAYQDKSGFALEYDVTTQSSGNNQDNPVSTSQVSLLNGKAKKPLTGKALAKGQQGRHLSKNAHVRDGTDKDIGFDSNGPGDVVLLQVELEDNGKTIFRSIVAETTSAPAPAATMDLASASVNDDGDVDLYFTGVPLEHAMIQALIMVELRGQVLEDQKIELSAIVDDGHLVLHGGWIRNALDKAGVTGATHGWKLLVAEAVALDPHKSYRPVATMSGKKDSAVSKNKHLLSSAPSDKEQGISSEMRTGRRPERRRLGARNLSGNHFKILVHGYWYVQLDFYPLSVSCSRVSDIHQSHTQHLLLFAVPMATLGQRVNSPTTLYSVTQVQCDDVWVEVVVPTTGPMMNLHERLIYLPKITIFTAVALLPIRKVVSRPFIFTEIIGHVWTMPPTVVLA